jgi:hypothetical protein
VQIQQISASSAQVEEANWNHWDPHIFSLTKHASNHAYLYSSVTKGVKKLPHSVEQLSLAANAVVSKVPQFTPSLFLLVETNTICQ